MGKAGAPRSDVVLLMTHFLDDWIVAEWHKLARDLGGRADLVLLYNRDDDACPRPFPPDMTVFPFGAADLQALGYPRKGRKLDPRDVEVFVLNFHRHHPHYRFYWVMEYDVRFSGPWHRLFDPLARSPSDLIGTTLHRHAVNPHWENWRSIEAPGGLHLPETDLIRGFFPFYRISNRALMCLDEAYRRGWSGHFEVVMPTILALSSLSLEDMGGTGEWVRPGNENRFYTNTPTSNDLWPGSFVFRPVFGEAGPEPDRLWHPVKPGQIREGWVTGRRRLLTRRAAAFARSLLLRSGPLPSSKDSSLTPRD